MKIKANIFGILLLFSPFPGTAQSDSDHQSNSNAAAIAKQIINSAGPCSLITIDKEGKPRARAMDALPVEDNFIVWFVTNPKSRKVDQIKNNQNVAVYYLAKDASGYITIYGTAQLVNKLESKKKYWKASWNDFYPDYPNGCLLIKVVPERLEIISEAHGITGDPVTWQPTTIKFVDK